MATMNTDTTTAATEPTVIITPMVDRLMACRRACEGLSDETVHAIVAAGGVKDLLAIVRGFAQVSRGRVWRTTGVPEPMVHEELNFLLSETWRILAVLPSTTDEGGQS